MPGPRRLYPGPVVQRETATRRFNGQVSQTTGCPATALQAHLEVLQLGLSRCASRRPPQLLKFQAGRVDPLHAIKHQADIDLLDMSVGLPGGMQRQQGRHHLEVKLADVDLSVADKRL